MRQFRKYGTARQATDDNKIRCICIARWISKATDTHSEQVIFIASPQQQWLGERASMLRYMYNACLVQITVSNEDQSWNLINAEAVS